MALSGSISNTFRTGYKLLIEWTATQNVSANQSTITAKMYLQSLGSSYTINSSASKDGANIIDGTTYTFSGVTADLNGNQKKLLATDTKTVTHNSDGTKTFSLDGYFNIDVTLGGTFYGTVNLTATNFTLNTIPRASTLTSSASWTAPNSLPLTINRASSSFTHDITIKVHNGTSLQTVKTFTGVGTSQTWTPTTGENTTLFDYLNNDTTNWNQATEITLVTKNGSTTIGTNVYTGTLSSPVASTGTISNPTGISESSGQENDTVYIDQTINLAITRANSSFTHTVRFKDGNSGSVIKEFTGVTTSVSWTPNTTEMNSLYSSAANTKELDGQIDILTFYNGQQVRATVGEDINYRVRNSDPVFTTFTYADTNSSVTSVTGNNQYIVQNKSTLVATILNSNKATGVNYATIVKYIAEVSGESITVNAPFSTDITFNFSTISASSNQNLVITAYDSRGFSKAVTLNVNVVPWSAPVVNASATRGSGFLDSTTLAVSGSINKVTVAGVDKNGLVALNCKYRTRVKNGTYGAYDTLDGGVVTLPNYTFSEPPFDLANTSAWDIEVTITDKFGATVTTLSVGAGTPIFFIDSDQKSVGVGKFTDNANSFESAHIMNIIRQYPALVFNDTDATYAKVFAITSYQNKLEFRLGANSTDNTLFNLNETTGLDFQGGQRTWTSATPLAIADFNNSDIIGLNGLHFNDSCNVMGEGLMFPKTGASSNSQVKTDYECFRLIDGKLFVEDGATSTTPFMFAEYAASRIAPSLLNSWVNYGSGYMTAGYIKQGGIVNLQFMIKDGTTTGGTTICTLPVGYRPGGTIITSCIASTGWCRIDVRSDGGVTIPGSGSQITASTTWIALNISFLAEN